MADFCNQCAREMGFEPGDLTGLTSLEAWQHNRACHAICEGCGVIQVDPDGNCASADCLVALGKSILGHGRSHAVAWPGQTKSESPS